MCRLKRPARDTWRESVRLVILWGYESTRRAGMAGMVRKSFDSPDETRPFEAEVGGLEVVRRGWGVVGWVVFECGWWWLVGVGVIGVGEGWGGGGVGCWVCGGMA